MSLRYAIVGCGAAGKVHAYHFAHDDRVECVAAADPSAASAAYFVEHFGFRRAYPSLEDLLRHETIDILTIASPPAAHLSQLSAALAAGVSVLCEKPLVVSLAEVDQLLLLLAGHRAIVSTMLPRRFYNNSQATRQVIASGALGAITRVTLDLQCRKTDEYYATWRGRKQVAGGGVLLSQTIHSIDQLVYFFGRPVRVDGSIRTLRQGLEVEDEAEATIEFESSVTAEIRASCNATDRLWQALTTIVGARGRIELDSAATVCWEVPGVPPPSAEDAEVVPEQYKPVYYGPGHRKVVQDFIGAVADNRASATPARAAVPSLSAILGIYRAAAAGAPCALTHGTLA